LDCPWRSRCEFGIGCRSCHVVFYMQIQSNTHTNQIYKCIYICVYTYTCVCGFIYFIHLSIHIPKYEVININSTYLYMDGMSMRIRNPCEFSRSLCPRILRKISTKGDPGHRWWY
jgi:hypothetical protein